jgi:hypothetical protein
MEQSVSLFPFLMKVKTFLQLAKVCICVPVSNSICILTLTKSCIVLFAADASNFSLLNKLRELKFPIRAAELVIRVVRILRGFDFHMIAQSTLMDLMVHGLEANTKMRWQPINFEFPNFDLCSNCGYHIELSRMLIYCVCRPADSFFSLGIACAQESAMFLSGHSRLNLFLQLRGVSMRVIAFLATWFLKIKLSEKGLSIFGTIMVTNNYFHCVYLNIHHSRFHRSIFVI